MEYFQTALSTCSMMDTQIYVQETFADIPDEFCDADDSSIIIGETIIEVTIGAG